MPRIRQEVLAATYLNPERWWYISDLAHHIGVRPSSIQRELSALTEAGILTRRQEGNRVYIQPNPDCPVTGELQGLLIKTIGIVEPINVALADLWHQIDAAFIYGSFARGEEFVTSDIDLMVIGSVGLKNLTAPLRDAEKQIAHPINVSVYSVEEFISKAKANNHFVKTILRSEKIFLKGNQSELAGTLE